VDYNFDKIIKRSGTDSLKYDFWAERGKPEGVLPLWVADMDFQVPPAVTAALKQKCRHAVYGYSNTKDDYFKPIYDWFKQGFGWELKPEWLVKTPGVVYSVCAAVRAFTEAGDAVLIQQPVYYPFTSAVTLNGRKLVVNRLKYEGGAYGIDFDDFEKKIAENKVRLFILCSPHNPVGRVWSAAELTRMGDICLRHGVLIAADEIHADFVYAGHKHTVLHALAARFSDITITCTAPTKTFNLAGLQIANTFISNKALREKYLKEVYAGGYNEPNIMGIVACKAAYSDGRGWLDALKIYLEKNLSYIRDFIKKRLPAIKLIEPEGTYLVWLDFSALGLDLKRRRDLVLHKARLWLDEGEMFGAGGEGFERLNIACPRSILVEAMTRLERAIQTIDG
jgi:cystathionine beta-lyase